MTQPDKPLVFDWGDGSPLSSAAYGETLEHTYPGPGTYLITVREAATNAIALTTYAYVASDDPTVLTVTDATVHTCQPSPFTATLTNGFAEIQQVYAFLTLKAAGLTASNTAYWGDDGAGGSVPIPPTNVPGGIQVINGPFTVPRDSDSTLTAQVRLPPTATGTVAGHVDYVTSTVEDPNTGVRALAVLISDDFVLTVAAGDCSSPPAPGTCSLSDIVPDPNLPIIDEDGVQTGTTSLPVSTGQGVQLTGLGLINAAAVIAITDDADGFPLLGVSYTEADDPDNPGSTLQFVSGYLGLLPCLDNVHIQTILVQDALNTTRCSIAVDWLYTPDPIPELPEEMPEADGGGGRI